MRGDVRRALFNHLAWHASVRMLSAALSFFAFSLIARRLDSDQANGAFSYLFALGFGVASVRLCVQLLANGTGSISAVTRARRAYKGMSVGLVGLPLFLPFLGYVLRSHSGSTMLAGFGCLVVVAANYDVDLLRGILKRPPLFSALFSLGACVASAGIYLHANLDKGSAIGWILVQWAPVAVVNAAIMLRPVVYRILLKLARSGGGGFSHSWSAFSVSVFDGLVLNAPFLGWASLSGSGGSDFSVGMRVFVSSLFMQPLLLHWANSAYFDELAGATRLRGATAFSTLLGVTSLLVGVGLLLFYSLVSTRAVSPNTVLIFVVLSCSYSFYAGHLRMTAPLIRPVSSFICVVLPIGVLALLLQLAPVRINPILLSMAQGAALIISGLLMISFRGRSAKGHF